MRRRDGSTIRGLWMSSRTASSTYSGWCWPTGKEISATADHRFRFAEGWRTLHQATGLEEKGGRAVWRTGDYYVHVNGLVAEALALYQDKEWLERQYSEKRRDIRDIAEDCGVSYHTIRKWLTHHELTDPSRGPIFRGRLPLEH